ncbi:MAG: hypothetical protein ACE5HS_13715 [bacterium]
MPTKRNKYNQKQSEDGSTQKISSNVDGIDYDYEKLLQRSRNQLWITVVMIVVAVIAISSVNYVLLEKTRGRIRERIKKTEEKIKIAETNLEGTVKRYQKLTDSLAVILTSAVNRNDEQIRILWRSAYKKGQERINELNKKFDSLQSAIDTSKVAIRTALTDSFKVMIDSLGQNWSRTTGLLSYKATKTALKDSMRKAQEQLASMHAEISSLKSTKLDSEKLKTALESFVTELGLNGLRVIHGAVNSAGKIIAGTGFSISSEEQGKYKLHFKTPFKMGPAIVAISEGIEDQGKVKITNFTINLNETNSYLNSYLIDTTDGIGEVSTSGAWSFIAIGYK